MSDVPADLTASVRAELRRLCDEPDLSAHLGTISRFAIHASDLFAIVKDPKAVLEDDHEVTTPLAPMAPPSAETFGAKMIREVLAAMPGIEDAKTKTPAAMVSAIVLARQNGLTDVSAELEKQLVGRVLDGDRPVTEVHLVGLIPKRVEDYLGPPRCDFDVLVGSPCIYPAGHPGPHKSGPPGDSP
jgi:hypothetical protein